MPVTNPPRFKPFFAFYGNPGTTRKKGLLPFLWSFWESVEIFLREYTKTITMGDYGTNAKNGAMVIEKNGLTIAPLHEKTIGGLPTTTFDFTPKKWFMVSFFLIFLKMRIF